MQIVTLEPEIPPYCSGNGMPRMPLSAKSFSMSFGYSAFCVDLSRARGYLVLDELADRVPNRNLLRGELKSPSQ